jgi:AcrR family transcriptional regulator
MAPKKKERISKKKLRIIETAIGLFTRYGIRRVTVEEICREAGASKMTFYKYFPNKIALLRSIYDGWFDEAYAKLDEIDAMEIPFPEKMRLLIEYKMKMLEQMSPEFIDEVVHADPELKDFFDQMKTENATRFMNFVEKAQQRGDMRIMHPALLFVILDKMKEIIENDDLRKLYNNDLDFIREIHDFFFFGVLPVKNDSTGEDQESV